MMRTIAWACLIFTLLPFAVVAETAQGRVFNDLNGNGIYDADEPGIAGVRVSDGVKVAQSDAQGAYSLER